jgi:hypothetical protein
VRWKFSSGASINMDTDSIPLKPCPFCKGKASLRERPLKGAMFPHAVVCETTQCGAQTAYMRTPYLAANAWNRRNGAY